MKCSWSCVYTEGNPGLLSRWQSFPDFTRCWLLLLHIQPLIAPPELRFLSDSYTYGGYFPTQFSPFYSYEHKNNIHILNNTLAWEKVPTNLCLQRAHCCCRAAPFPTWLHMQKTFLLMNVTFVWHSGVGRKGSGGAMQRSGQEAGKPPAQPWQL